MIESLRALQVEDSDTDAKLIAHELRKVFRSVHTQRVDNPASLGGALDTGSWDVIICDWSMPNFSALGAIDLVKSRGLDVPLIIVSGTVGEEAAIAAMRAGAMDYVLKGNLARLIPAIEREIRDHRIRAARRQSEERLRVSEARFARLAESGVIGITIADVLGNIHEANDAYLRLVGYSREEMLQGQVRWEEITPLEFKAHGDRAVELLKANGVAPPWETEQIRKDGVRVPVMIAAAMLDYPNCIAVVTDISERKKAEEALRRTEEQLRHAQKMEAIGVLAGGVAHDFNNILSVILGYSGMMLEDLRPNDPMREHVVEINLAGERGTTLTRQLLAFSRQQIIEPAILDLNVLLRGMDNLLRRLIREDVKLVVVPAPALGRCKGDAGQIEQIVMNLVINARDAMPDGGTLTIETGNVNFNEDYAGTHLGIKPGHYVMLAVTDTGIGMSKATQARIFEPFFTTKEKGKGTGLGLSIVFGIVEQSGGSVRVYSEIGRGTSFKIYLPLTEEEQALASAKANVTASKGSETILLVEDEDQIRNVTTGILSRYGYQVIAACNGEDALLKFQQYSATIHLLITDVMMPGMTGKQLADRLRPLRPEMKVLFMSGYTDGALVGHLAAGSAFLQKPITPASLSKKVRELLDSGSGEHST